MASGRAASWIPRPLVFLGLLLFALPAVAAPGRGRCPFPDGASFASVEALDRGMSPAGPVRGPWTLRFADGRFDWSWSDVGESGTYRCQGRRVVARGPAGMRTGRYDPRTGLLRWVGHVYRLQSAPRPESPPPSPGPVTPPSPPLRTPERRVKDSHIPPLARDDAERRGCASHGDCTVSCDVDGDCCRARCGCGVALNRAFAERLRDYRDRQCDGRTFDCPAVGCALRGPYTATCRNGLCEAHEGLGGW